MVKWRSHRKNASLCYLAEQKKMQSESSNGEPESQSVRKGTFDPTQGSMVCV